MTLLGTCADVVIAWMLANGRGRRPWSWAPSSSVRSALHGLQIDLASTARGLKRLRDNGHTERQPAGPWR